MNHLEHGHVVVTRQVIASSKEGDSATSLAQSRLCPRCPHHEYPIILREDTQF